MRNIVAGCRSFGPWCRNGFDCSETSLESHRHWSQESRGSRSVVIEDDTDGSKCLMPGFTEALDIIANVTEMTPSLSCEQGESESLYCKRAAMPRYRLSSMVYRLTQAVSSFWIVLNAAFSIHRSSPYGLLPTSQ